MIGTRFIALPSIAAGLAVWEVMGGLSPPVLLSPASAVFVYLWQQTVTLALPIAIGGSSRPSCCCPPPILVRRLVFDESVPLALATGSARLLRSMR